MFAFLPKEVQAGLDAARRKALQRSHRLRIEADGESYSVLNLSEGGFTLKADQAPKLRGRVDLYDGPRLISKCLIVACGAADGELHFEYKRMTEATDQQPVDFVRTREAPVALLTQT